MPRILLTTALLVTATIASTASADHLDRLRRDYELDRVELTNDYRSRQEALRFAYNRQRDGLLLERKRAYRIDCPDTRSARVRSLNRAIGDLARDHAARNRKVTAWYTETSRALRSNYDYARKNVRRAARPVVIESRIPLAFGTHSVNHAHPADCSCSICAARAVPARPINPSCELDRSPPRIGYGVDYGAEFGSRYRESVPYRANRVYSDDLRYGGATYHEDYRGASRSRGGNAVNIASLILGLLNN